MDRFLHGGHLGKRRGFNQRMLVWLREPKQASERTVDQAVPWSQVTNINWAWHKPGWEWEWAYPTRNPRGGAIALVG